MLTLTPKPKVLKKVKKNWSHEMKHATSHYYENVSRQGERRTENHWNSRPETHPLCYQDDTAWVKNWPLYLNRIMWGGSVE